jgi:predicted dehydrogenase
MGRWGIDWANRVLPQVYEVKLVGAVDRDIGNASRISVQLDNLQTRFFPSLEAAIEKVSVDAVLITTQTASHADLIRSALNHGLHVLVEKPFVEIVDEAAELVALAERRSCLAMVSQNYRFFPAARMAADMVRSNSLGRLYRISVDFRRSVARGDHERAAWLRTQPQPLLKDLAIHHFDLMRMVSGLEPQKVFCRSGKPPNSKFVDSSSASAIIDFGPDLIATWRGTWESSGDETPYSGEWRLEFENGDVLWTCRGDRDISLDADRLVTHINGKITPQQLNRDQLFGRAGALKAFVDSIKGRSVDPYLPTAANNLGSLALMEAIVQSAALQQPQEVKL